MDRERRSDRVGRIIRETGDSSGIRFNLRLAIRYDGLYAPESQAGHDGQEEGKDRRLVRRRDWLRFYPTGEVTGYPVWAIPRTAEKYTRLRSKGVARGTLHKDGDRVSFQLRGPDTLISYQGVVEPDALVLSSDDKRAQRDKPSERYGFYPVNKLAPRPDGSTDASKPAPKPRKEPKPPSFGFPPAFGSQRRLGAGERPRGRNRRRPQAGARLRLRARQGGPDTAQYGRVRDAAGR